MIRVHPLAFKPVGSHMHIATGGGWLYIVCRDPSGWYSATVAGDLICDGPCLAACLIAAQRRHRENVLTLLEIDHA